MTVMTVMCVCAAAMVLGACGTTVGHGTGTGDVGGMAAPGGITATSLAARPTAPTGAAQAVAPTRPSASTAMTGGAAGGDAVGFPQAPVSSARSAAPIEVGTYYLNGGNAALSAAGFGGLVIPDNKPVFDAFVAYINGHGGLAGRQIKPVYFAYQEGGDPHGQDAAACAVFTQDHHVALVMGGINSGAGELMPCLAAHGVPLIGSGGGGDARYFAKYHQFDYEPDQMNFTGGLQVLVADLQRRGYLSGVHKVGLVQYPGDIYTNAVNDGLVPALAAVGLKLTDRYATTSSTDNGAIANTATNAELKFATEGIDLVLFMTPGGAAETYFMTAASSQHYHPKYGIWSADSPFVLVKTAPKAQLTGTIGIGYEPGLDVATDQDPTAKTAAGKACLEFGQRLHLDESGLGNPLVRASCDDWFPLLRVVNQAPDTTASSAALERGFDALRSSYQSASTFAMQFLAGRHDEARGYRDLAFDGGCSCFAYLGSTLVTP
jgi:hypothetical protein